MKDKYRKIAAHKIFTGNKVRPWIHNGFVVFDQEGRVVEVSNDNAIASQPHSTEYYNGIMVPGLVNAHLHLELSHLKGKISKGKGLASFVSQMTNLHRDSENYTIQATKAIEYYDKQMAANGVVLAADIVNSDITIATKQKSNIHYINFIEMFGLREDVADQQIDYAKSLYNLFSKAGLKTHFAPHSTYSISYKIYEAIKDLLKDETITTIHFLEGREEQALFSGVNNEFAKILRNISHNLPYSSYKSLYLFLTNLISVNINLLLVHNTFITEELAEKLVNNFPNLYFVLNPTSNMYVENTLPPEFLIKKYPDKILIGTDSLATNYSLDIKKEILLLHNTMDVDLTPLLFAATINGAKALGQDKYFGSFEVGKKPGWTIIELS